MENAAEYDLIVAGAGPAGCACAITAARAGCRVLLLEKDRLPRHKVCGEFVSPESLGLLRSLLGQELFSSQPEIAKARIFLDGKCVSLSLGVPARSIPRFDLDAALLDSARALGSSVREETTVREVQNCDGHFQVSAAGETFTSKAVVNATGRWSQLSQPKAGAGAKWIGLKAHFREAASSQSVDLYFFRGGYCGVQPVSNTTVNACAMVRADVARSLPEVFARHPELWRRSRDWEPLFPALTTSGLIFREPETQDGDVLLAGDAAGFIDPFAGDGISLALHSGTLAAECLGAFLRAECSLAGALGKYSAGYRNRFGGAFKNAARVRAFLQTPVLLRRALLPLAAVPLFSKMIVRGTRVK